MDAQTAISKPRRLLEIEALPYHMQDFALVDWSTVCIITASKDVENTREIITKAGVPLVRISERKKLPRWGELRTFLLGRETIKAGVRSSTRGVSE